MAIPRNDNCSPRSVAFCAGLALCAVLGVRAGEPTASPVRPSPGLSPAVMTPQAAEETVARLRLVLQGCRDDNVAGNIRYSIGVTYFKAGMMAQALATLEPIASTTQGSDLLRACSWNMVGQIRRLRGENARAADAFGRLADLCAPPPAPAAAAHPAFRQLRGAALISRAEIRALQKDYAAAAADYERLLQTETGPATDEGTPDPRPLVMDRLSQLYLQQRDPNRYLHVTTTLLARFPAYGRTPVVELENLCVRVLQDVQPTLAYPQGALYAPVQVTAYLRRPQATRPAAPILADVEQICRKHRHTGMSVLLEYLFAGMLDAAGRPDQALDVLARLPPPGPPTEGAAPETGPPDTEENPKPEARNSGTGGSATRPAEAQDSASLPSRDEVLREYAVLQRALLLTEKRSYSEALQLLASLPSDPETRPHLARLSASLVTNIQTLKREVLQNGIPQEK